MEDVSQGADLAITLWISEVFWRGSFLGQNWEDLLLVLWLLGWLSLPVIFPHGIFLKCENSGILYLQCIPKTATV